MPTYGSVDGVTALVPTLGELSEISTPTATGIEAWLAEAYAKINRAIGNAGYSTPIGSSVALYPELTGLENLYAAAYALRSTGIDVASGETESRSEVWLRDFYSQLGGLAASNLALAGATPLPATTTGYRRRIRTIQTRKVDGFARGNVTESYEVRGGEYTGYTAPAE